MSAVLRLVTSVATVSGLLVGPLLGIASGASAQTFVATDLAAPAAPRAAEALLLDVARAGDRLVAVGLQGVIVTSDDNGGTWTQAAVPVSSMLTAVAFADAQHGWAIGHAGAVLRSDDGGRTWRRVAVAAAADTSLLDVLVLAPGQVLVAGAYGVLSATHDDGATWAKLAPPAEDLHINRLTRGREGAIYAAGESGTLAVSRDAGATWNMIESPYDGSFYGLHELASGRLLAHGLRGHAFFSDDAGATWTQITISEPVLLMAACEPTPGVVVLAGLGGHLFVSHDNGAMFDHTKPDGLTSTAEITPARDGTMIAVGETGVHRITLP